MCDLLSPQKEGLVVQEKKVQEDAERKAANPKKRKRVRGCSDTCWC